MENYSRNLSARWPLRRAAIIATVMLTSAAWGQATANEWDKVTPAASINVPAGTPLEIELTQGINTAKVKAGLPVYAQLHSDVLIDGLHTVEAGAPVQGSIAEVASGSKKIGGAPRLVLTFNSITARDGTNVPISARYKTEGSGETAKDAAKIAGGAAAGAVVGHQVDDDKGAVIGGVLGAAAGSAAAKNTGGDIKLPAGTVLKVTTQSAADIQR